MLLSARLLSTDSATALTWPGMLWAFGAGKAFQLLPNALL
jgi:hypothetical protein